MNFIRVLPIRIIRFLGSIMLLLLLFIALYCPIASLLHILINYDFYKDVVLFLNLLMDLFSIEVADGEFANILIKKTFSFILMVVSFIGMLIVMLQLSNMHFKNKVYYILRSLTFRNVKEVFDKDSEETI